MFGMLERVIQDPRCQLTIKYGYVAFLRKQHETGCHSLLFVAFQRCVRYPLAQLVRLTFAVQVKPDSFIRNLEAFGRLATGFALVLLYSRHWGLIIQDL